MNEASKKSDVDLTASLNIDEGVSGIILYSDGMGSTRAFSQDVAATILVSKSAIHVGNLYNDIKARIHSESERLATAQQRVAIIKSQIDNLGDKQTIAKQRELVADMTRAAAEVDDIKGDLKRAFQYWRDEVTRAVKAGGFKLTVPQNKAGVYGAAKLDPIVEKVESESESEGESESDTSGLEKVATDRINELKSAGMTLEQVIRNALDTGCDRNKQPEFLRKLADAIELETATAKEHEPSELDKLATS